METPNEQQTIEQVQEYTLEYQVDLLNEWAKNFLQKLKKLEKNEHNSF
jgi:hypothetical protein